MGTRWWRFFLPLGWLVIAGLFGSGCTTVDQEWQSAGHAAWKIQSGQAVWRPGRDLPEIAGDLMVARDDAGQCLVRFEKSPLTLYSGQTTSNHWSAEFPPRGIHLRGHRPAPTRIAWLYLPDALAGSPLPKDFTASLRPDGGWTLENSRTGERIEGYCSP